MSANDGSVTVDRVSTPGDVGIELDPEAAARQKAHRRRRLNTVQVPRLRVVGMAFLSGVVLLHNALIAGEGWWRHSLGVIAVLERDTRSPPGSAWRGCTGGWDRSTSGSRSS